MPYMMSMRYFHLLRLWSMNPTFVPLLHARPSSLLSAKHFSWYRCIYLYTVCNHSSMAMRFDSATSRLVQSCIPLSPIEYVKLQILAPGYRKPLALPSSPQHRVSAFLSRHITAPPSRVVPTKLCTPTRTATISLSHSSLPRSGLIDRPSSRGGWFRRSLVLRGCANNFME